VARPLPGFAALNRATGRVQSGAILGGELLPLPDREGKQEFVENGSAAVARRARPRRNRADDPLEVGLRSRIAVDRHMLRNVKL
jgi:hypothetical protein